MYKDVTIYYVVILTNVWVVMIICYDLFKQKILTRYKSHTLALDRNLQYVQHICIMIFWPVKMIVALNVHYWEVVTARDLICWWLNNFEGNNYVKYILLLIP